MLDLPTPVDLAPFAMRADRQLSPEWMTWLGSVLRGERPAPAGPPPEDFEQALPALFDHAILPLVYLELRDEGAGAHLPPALCSTLTGAFQTSAMRTVLLEAELNRIVAGLARAHIPVALLKGLALSRTIYPNMAARPINDLDLLIPADAVDGARDVLVGLGYEGLSLPHRGQVGRWLRRYRAEIAMTGQVEPCRGVLAELHWSLAELPYYTQRIDMTNVWASTVPVSDLHGAVQPGPAVLMLHACAHLSLHHSRNLRLIWLVDMDRLARTPDFPWSETVSLAQQWNLGLVLLECLNAVARWLGTPIPPDVLEHLAALATDPVGRAMWGLGDERPGRAWRRAGGTLAVFSPRDRLSYLAWLGLRLLLRPYEAVTRPSSHRAVSEAAQPGGRAAVRARQ